MILFVRNMFIFVGLFFLASCGGGGGSGGSTEVSEVKVLKLKVGNLSVDSNSSIPSRFTTEISGDSKTISKITTNKPSAVSLSGGLDVSLFQITGENPNKELSFKTLPDRFNPADSNADGIYEVDIKAEDEDDQVVIIKFAYKIVIPRNAKKILSGKILFTNLKDNQYTKVEYTDTSRTTTTYEASGKVVTTRNDKLIYEGLAFSFLNDKKIRLTCQVSETPSINLNCEDEGKNESYPVAYLTEAPVLSIPESYKVIANSEQTHNSYNKIYLDIPIIDLFSIKGNQAIENNKVVVSKSSYHGQFNIVVVLSNFITPEKTVYIGLKGANKSLWVTTKPGYPLQKKIDLSCVYNNSNSGGVSFTCENYELAATKGSNDTEMLVYSCDKSPINTKGARCNYASIPILFVE